MSKKYDYMHILPSEYGGYSVKGYDTYPAGSVLEGQTRINFIDSFESIEEAKKAFPEATMSNAFMEPVNTYDHLPPGLDEEGYNPEDNW